MTIDTVEQEAQTAVSSTEIVLCEAQELTITSNEEFQIAGVMLRGIATRYKDIDDQRKRLTQPLDESKRRIMDMFRPALDQLSDARKLVDASILDWNQQERERLRREEAERAEEARLESERLQAEAAQAADEGRFEVAATLEGQAEQVVPQEVAAPPKAHGVSTRTDYRAEVVDKMAFIQAVARADSKIPLDAVDINMVVVNRAVQLHKDGLNWPGVNVVKKEVVVARMGLRSADDMPRGGAR